MAPPASRGALIDLALLVLRLAGVFMAANHGWGKLTRLMAGETGFVAGVEQLGFPYPLVFAWAAALTETVGAALVALGLFTRPAAALSAFGMGVAAFARHRAHLQWLSAFGLGQYPADTIKGWGNYELALIYLLVFGALALAGAGRFSMDGLLARRR